MIVDIPPITPRIAVTGSILLTAIKDFTQRYADEPYEDWPMIIQYQDHFGKSQFYNELVTISASRLDTAYQKACGEVLDMGGLLYEQTVVPEAFAVMQHTQNLHLSDQNSWDQVVLRIVNTHALKSGCTKEAS